VSGPLRHLLLSWFPSDSQRSGAIQQAISLAVEEFGSLFEEPVEGKHNKRVQIALVYADALVDSYRSVQDEHDLPPADDAHAFWALYWHRLLTASGGWNATVAERFIAHLCALREPAHVHTRHDVQIARRLCEVAITAVEAALALTVRGIVDDPSTERRDFDENERGFGIVDRAYLLVAGRSSATDRRLMSKLLDAAWIAYMLTGESALVETISLLAEECDISSTPGDGLIELYLETIPHSPGEIPLLPSDGDSAHSAIADHARARAAWLAAITKPLTRRGDSSWLVEKATEASVTLQGVVERAAERMLADAPTASESLDYVTLAVVTSWQTLVRRYGEATDGLLA